jgi:ElaB/YqjD/DUF883 family membrane-anchored ribosome-binding protein
MTSDPEQLRRDIEATRLELGADVEALNAKVNPGEAVQRRAQQVRDVATDLKDRVMGSAASSAKAGVRSTASEAADAVERSASATGEMASSAADAVRSAPQRVQRQAQGNPLAAGLIAFGAGWLISTLLPPTRQEEKLAERATDTARDHGPTVARGLGQAGVEVRENLRGPVLEAAESVRSTATDAASTVAEEGRRAAGAVGERAQEAKDRLQDT